MYSKLEEGIVSNYMDMMYPQPEVETQQPSIDGVQLAMGGNAAGRKSDRPMSDIPQALFDVGAGFAREGVAQAAGVFGDIESIGRGLRSVFNRPEDEGRINAFLRGMKEKTFLPTTEQISKEGYTIPGTDTTVGPLPPAIPPGVVDEERRKASAAYGGAFGAIAPLPSALDAGIKGVKTIAKSLPKNLPVGMSTEAVGGMDGVLQPAVKASAPVNDMGFYSAVEQAALNIQRKSGTGQAMLNDITKGQDVKLDEVKWIGLDDFLKGKKNVTREEVQQFIAANKVDIQEVTLGGDFKPMTDPQEAINYLAKEKGLTPEQLVDEYGYNDLNDYVTLANDVAQPAEAKFKTWTLPGGENYREILLTMPSKEAAPTRETFNIYNAEGRMVSQGMWPPSERAQQTLAANPGYRLERGSIETARPNDYTSSHWDEKNVLAHIRVNDRVDADGKKMLLVEEVQSDWHQAGRGKGYHDKEKLANSEKTIKELKAEHKRLGEVKAQAETPEEKAAISEQRLAIMGQIRDASILPSDHVPDAPMKDTWYQLALKRVLKYAADNGYERIGLTTGKTNAERFDLSKQIDTLSTRQMNDGYYMVVATDKNGKTVIENAVKEDALPDVVGKEMSQKIISDKGGDYSGLDLQVGGEGMKKYYDEVYPQFLAKYGKKWGSKVGETYLPIYDGKTQKSGAEPIRFVDITPEMRQGVGKGQPLFSATAAGAGTGAATMQDKENK